MKGTEKELWIIGAIIVAYAGFVLFRFLMYLIHPWRDLYWIVGFWFDKTMRLRTKFAILGLHLLGMYSVTIIYRVIRDMMG